MPWSGSWSHIAQAVRDMGCDAFVSKQHSKSTHQGKRAVVHSTAAMHHGSFHAFACGCMLVCCRRSFREGDGTRRTSCEVCRLSAVCPSVLGSRTNFVLDDLTGVMSEMVTRRPGGDVTDSCAATKMGLLYTEVLPAARICPT